METFISTQRAHWTEWMRLAWGPNPDKSAALQRMTEALELAQRIRASGGSVRDARKALKQARRAFEAEDYRTAMELANQAIQSCGYPVPTRPAPTSWNAGSGGAGWGTPPVGSGPDRSTALDRMTEALEVAKHARDRGVDVHQARASLKRARDAFERGDYRTAMEEADRIIESFRPIR